MVGLAVVHDAHAAAAALAPPATAAEVASKNQMLRLSLDLNGDDPDADAFVTDISRDGRLVVFSSAATDITDDDVDTDEFATDVFVADLNRHVIDLISEPGGTLPDSSTTRRPQARSPRPGAMSSSRPGAS